MRLIIRFWAVAILVFTADQAAKLLVLGGLAKGVSQPVMDGILSFTLVLNTGGAFGVLASSYTVLLLAAVLAVVLIVVGHPYLVRSGYGAAAALLLGGAAGNLLDRVRLGAVVDFIDFGFWPVFNVADVAIVVGVALLLYRALVSRDPGGEVF